VIDLWGYAAAALGVIAAFVAAYFTGRRSGAVARDLAASRKRVDDLKAAIEVRIETDAKTDVAVRDNLGGWVRPE
jgi:uncharacterized membrane protein YdjX (TVP38/TMEM64 family)